MSLNELWGHCIDGRTIVQESSTGLIIDSNPGYVFGSTPMSEWVWVQEESLSQCLYALEDFLGMFTELTSEGPNLPFLLSPLLHLNLLFMLFC